MNNDNGGGDFVLFMAGIILGIAIGSGLMKGIYGSERSRAIEANVAEWQIDPKTGDKEFAYLTPEEICEQMKADTTAEREKWATRK